MCGEPSDVSTAGDGSYRPAVGEMNGGQRTAHGLDRNVDLSAALWIEATLRDAQIGGEPEAPLQEGQEDVVCVVDLWGLHGISAAPEGEMREC